MSDQHSKKRKAPLPDDDIVGMVDEILEDKGEVHEI